MTRIDAHHHIARPAASPRAADGPSPRTHGRPATPALAVVRRDVALRKDTP
jgi:hypothetical protein